MATILQTFGANTSLTVADLATLDPGSTATSNEIDNSSGKHLAADIQLVADTNATPDGTVDVHYMRANDTGDYPSIDQTGNMIWLMSLDNSASTPLINRRIEQLPEFLKIVVINNTDTALANAAIEYQFADLTNA